MRSTGAPHHAALGPLLLEHVHGGAHKAAKAAGMAGWAITVALLALLTMLTVASFTHSATGRALRAAIEARRGVRN